MPVVAADRDSAMGSVTVRLYPIAEEHTLPLLVDIGFFFVAFLVWTAAGGPVSAGSVFLLLVLTALVHVVQMWWLVADRFDESGVTIVRTWRRRHVPWSQISGLVYTHKVEPTWTQWGKTPYRLRLVLKDNAPPVGRFLTDAQLERFATGPILMAVKDPADDWRLGDDNRELRCARQVYAELERHGFPAPPPKILKFRTPRYTPEEVDRAAVIDMMKLHPVTVTHGPLAAWSLRVLDTELPALAAEAGTLREINREPTYAIFSFETPAAADAFMGTARAAAPPNWSIADGALPAVS
jgi:hypothetical protein